MFNEEFLTVVGELMNLVTDVERIQKNGQALDIKLDEYRYVVNNILRRNEYSNEEIALVWSGEIQLTSS